MTRLINSFNGIRFNFLNVLSVLVLVGCFIFFFWICNNSKMSENHNIGEIKTALIAAMMLILNYHFGSSKSSSRKDETIQTMAETNKQ